MKRGRLLLASVLVFLILFWVGRYLKRKKLAGVKLSENFNLSEFVRTATGLDNIPGPDAIERLRKLVIVVLQPLRSRLGRPVIVTSGYRSPVVNAAVPDSSNTSQHKTGEAADIQVPGLSNRDIIEAVISAGLPFDQLIDEDVKGKQWVHVSFRANGPQRRQMLAARWNGSKVVYSQYA